MLAVDGIVLCVSRSGIVSLAAVDLISAGSRVFDHVVSVACCDAVGPAPRSQPIRSAASVEHVLSVASGQVVVAATTAKGVISRAATQKAVRFLCDERVVPFAAMRVPRGDVVVAGPADHGGFAGDVVA